jgi:hypothetical protein
VFQNLENFLKSYEVAKSFDSQPGVASRLLIKGITQSLGIFTPLGLFTMKNL